MKRILGEIAGAASIVLAYVAMPSGSGDVALAFPVAAVIGAVAVIGGALISSNAQKKATEAQIREAKRREGLLEADKFSSLVSGLQGQNRELAAMGAIPGFQSAAATANARSGTTGTGVGNALTTAAGGAGELFALQNAIQTALGLRGSQIGIPMPPQFGGSGLATGLNAIGQGLLASSQKSDSFSMPQGQGALLRPTPNVPAGFTPQPVAGGQSFPRLTSP